MNDEWRMTNPKSLTISRQANELTFTPHWLVKNPHLQTVIASRWRPAPGEIVSSAQKMCFDVVDEEKETIHLTGCYSPQTGPKSSGLVLLLHGWLGSVEATYMLKHGEFLFQQGYSIFRLNMRDHGDTMALNEGLFHGCRLEEVFQAACQVAALEPDTPFFILGFSMGGNFALRIARRHGDSPIPNLQHVLAISPSADPGQTVDALDSSPIYRHYFRRKLRRSLAAKQNAFPTRYDFNHIMPLKTCTAMTDAIIEMYDDFPDKETYYQLYACTPDKLRPINVPATILAAADDPIVHIHTIQPLANINPFLSLHITQYGGHVGFIDLFPFRSWLSHAILRLLRQQET